MHILDLFPWTRPHGTHHHPKSAKSKPCFTTRNSTEYNTSAGCFATATTLPACSPKMKVPRIEVLMEEAIATSRFLRFRPGLVERICFKDSASCRGCLCQIQSNANQTCKVEKDLKRKKGGNPLFNLSFPGVSYIWEGQSTRHSCEIPSFQGWSPQRKWSKTSRQ